MKKLLIFNLFLVCMAGHLNAQKYFTRTGKISFSSEAPMEKIEAQNNKATSVIDVATGKMEFAVLIKAFQFEKALMQEHFNENYMESSEFPKAKFKGKIKNISKVDFGKDGDYVVEVVGNLTMHGVTQIVETKGMLKMNGGLLSAKSTFDILVADYDIVIPAVVRENIAKTVSITVDINDYQIFKK